MWETLLLVFPPCKIFLSVPPVVGRIMPPSPLPCPCPNNLGPENMLGFVARGNKQPSVTAKEYSVSEDQEGRKDIINSDYLNIA